MEESHISATELSGYESTEKEYTCFQWLRKYSVCYGNLWGGQLEQILAENRERTI